MAAVDSFDTKKFFFFSRSAVEGEGQCYHALRENIALVSRWGRYSTVRNRLEAINKSDLSILFTYYC